MKWFLLVLVGLGILGPTAAALPASRCAEAYEFQEAESYGRWTVGLAGFSVAVPLACTSPVSVDGSTPQDDKGRLVVFRSCRVELGETETGGRTVANLLGHPDIGIDKEQSTYPIVVRVDNREVRSLSATLVEMTGGTGRSFDIKPALLKQWRNGTVLRIKSKGMIRNTRYKYSLDGSYKALGILGKLCKQQRELNQDKMNW